MVQDEPVAARLRRYRSCLDTHYGSHTTAYSLACLLALPGMLVDSIRTCDPSLERKNSLGGRRHFAPSSRKRQNNDNEGSQRRYRVDCGSPMI